MINPHLIKRPVITEKSIGLASSRNTYTFEVERTASKKQIQTTVEALYKVEVISVNTVVGYSSRKATGRRRIKVAQPRTKKALVTLKSGQTIALFDLTGAGAQE